MPSRATVNVAAVTLFLLLPLTACSPSSADAPSVGSTAATGSDDAPADTGSAGSGGAAEDCSDASTEGWDLFRDDRLTITPTDDVVSLRADGDVISFVDTAPSGWTTYSYSLGYIDDSGSVHLTDAAIFVGAENTQTFELEGPQVPSGADGGPYAGVLQIEATDDGGTTPLARICVLLGS